MNIRVEQRGARMHQLPMWMSRADKHKELTESISYARRIQEAMMLKEKHLQRIFAESFIYYRPKDIVSGDFYWFTKQGPKVIVAAADCTGHGIPGAFMSVLGISLLNQLIMEDKMDDPAAILHRLDHKIRKAFYADEERDGNDGMDIALCCIDHDEMKISFSGALRPVYVYNKEGINELKGSRHSIGGYAHSEGRFENTNMSFDKGDRLYLFTDGYPDQFGGAYNKKLLIRTFRSILDACNHYPMSCQKQHLDKKLMSWRGNQDQTDDVLVLGIKL